MGSDAGTENVREGVVYGCAHVVLLHEMNGTYHCMFCCTPEAFCIYRNHISFSLK